MTTFMLYAMVVGVLVALGARAVESLCRTFVLQVRWTWAAALVVALSLAAVAPRRSATSNVGFTVRGVVSKTIGPATARQASLLDRLRAKTTWAVEATTRPLTQSLARIDRATPARVNDVAVASWIVSSLLVLALVVGVVRRARAAQRRWPVAHVEGERVRVAPNAGPVVLGYLRPEIVVPAWLFECGVAERRLAVAHEAEHVRARDPLLLGAACVGVALMPWNPAVWYMLSRLRLAVELDCDSRLLRRGAAARAYGALLIDVAERAAPLRLAALALAGDRSHLHQRILAMKTETPKYVLARGGIAAALGLVALLAACEAKLPTQSDVAQMDAASAERTLATAQLVDRRDSIKYVIDGIQATAIQAHRLKADTIATISVRGKTAGGTDTIYFKTLSGKAYLEKIQTENAAREAMGGKGRVGGPGDATNDAVKVRGEMNANVPIYIDGVLSDMATMKRLNPKDIDNIEVIKGAAAARLNPDVPNAAGGIIKVTTKHAPK